MEADSFRSEFSPFEVYHFVIIFYKYVHSISLSLYHDLPFTSCLSEKKNNNVDDLVPCLVVLPRL